MDLIDRAFAKGRTASIVIAGSNSSPRARRNADYICKGVDDQVLINAAIASLARGSLFFAPDAIFSLSGQINLKSDVALISNGAIIKNIDQVTSPLAQAAAAGQKLVKVVSTTGFNPDMQVEMRNAAYWESVVIANVDPLTNTLTTKTNLVNSYAPADTVFSNFSFLVGTGVSNISLRGLTVEGNKANNIQSNDTNYAQNGVEFNNSSSVSVQDCYLHAGNRHGILYSNTPSSSIINCICNAWEEHGIDIFALPGGQTPPLLDTGIIGCTANDNAWCGIQLHRGSGVTGTNNKCARNGMYGICAGREYAHDNSFSTNTCVDNQMSNIMVEGHSHNISLVGNIARDGMITSGGGDGIQIDTCTDISLDHNQLTNNLHSIRIYGSTRCLATYNHCIDGVSSGGNILLDGTSTRNQVKGNVVGKTVLDTVKPAIAEGDATDDYNIIQDNQVFNSAATLSIKGANTVSAPNYIY